MLLQDTLNFRLPVLEDEGEFIWKKRKRLDYRKHPITAMVDQRVPFVLFCNTKQRVGK